VRSDRVVYVISPNSAPFVKVAEDTPAPLASEIVLGSLVKCSPRNPVLSLITIFAGTDPQQRR